MSKSKVYLVGAGPGDDTLITVKGAYLISEADCIIYDYLVNPKLLEARKNGCKLIYVGKKAGSHTLSQGGINKLLVKEARRFTNVVRLKGGDPFIFGRGAEEALYLKKNNIEFEIVPGVTSAIAVPSYAGIPLTERTRTSSVGFITGHEDPSKMDSAIDWSALVKAFGTLVFLMGVKNLPLITKKLIESGKSKTTPIAVIRWGTTPEQKTVTGTLSNIVMRIKKAGIKPPAIIVVGEVVRMREDLKWFEKRPLFGKRIIVTRTREQAGLLCAKLKDLGADAIEIPTINIVSLKADKRVKAAFLKDTHDWVFFTSQNGVKEFYEILSRIKKDVRILGKAKICAIGSETAKSLMEIGIRPDCVPSIFTAEGIIEYFKNKNIKDAKMLILRAKKARNTLAEGLKRMGANIKIINLYDTLIPAESRVKAKRILSEGADIVTFTSSSTAENFTCLLGKNYKKLLKGVKIASIGPVTSGTIRKLGLKVNIEAKKYTIDGLVKALEKTGDNI